MISHDGMENNFLRFYMLKEGVRLISSTDWLIDEQSDKITFLQGVEAIQGVGW